MSLPEDRHATDPRHWLWIGLIEIRSITKLIYKPLSLQSVTSASTIVESSDSTSHPFFPSYQRGRNPSQTRCQSGLTERSTTQWVRGLQDRPLPKGAWVVGEDSPNKF